MSRAVVVELLNLNSLRKWQLYYWKRTMQNFLSDLEESEQGKN